MSLLILLCISINATVSMQTGGRARIPLQASSNSPRPRKYASLQEQRRARVLIRRHCTGGEQTAEQIS